MPTPPVADKGTRPVALTVEPDGIPGELKCLNRWVLWRYDYDRGKGRWMKPPLNPYTGRAASTNKPAQWSAFDVALAAYRAGRGKADGLGIVLSSGPDDPLDLAVIDTDRPGLGGAIQPLATSTYTEHSPTVARGGLHAWFRGELPPELKGRPEVQAYSARQYVTVTGHRLDGSPEGLARPAPDLLRAVLGELGLLPEAPAPPPPVEAPGVEAEPRSQELVPYSAEATRGEDALLAAAFRASNGAAIKPLFDGDASGYASDSDADMALCNYLAFYFGDPHSLDHVFRRSALMRPKWDEVHYADGRTYGQATVAEAVAKCRDHYKGGAKRQAGGRAGKASTPDASTGGGAAGGGGGGAAPRNGRAAGSNGHAPPPAEDGWLRGCDLPDTDPDWFWEPYVERGDLSLLVGRTGTGKSHLLTELAARARLPAILPGFEEGRGSKLRRRLLAAGVCIENVLWNPRRYYLPSEHGTLLAGLRARGADLLLIDPAISYMDPGLNANGEEIRPFLECLAQVASTLGIPVVAVRHSAKARGNPVKGSSAWEEVPRSVMELVRLDDGRRVLRHYKSGQGEAAPPWYFTISGPKTAGRLALGKPVNPAMAAALDAQSDPDECDKLTVAMGIIKRCLTDGTGQLLERREARVVLGCGRAAGISEPTMHRARRALGVKSLAEEHGPGTKSHWHPPETGWPEE